MSRDAVPDMLDDDFGGETKAHYEPVPPRMPAATPAPYPMLDAAEREFMDAHGMIGAPIAELRATMMQHASVNCEICAPRTSAPYAEVVVHAPASSAPPSIAEMFQETLWRAYRAGVMQPPMSDDDTRAAYEAWYARAVLR